MQNSVDVLRALTVEETTRLFDENPDVAAIGMDACLESDRPDTLELTRDIRARYAGPIIAISGDPEFRRLQRSAGCSHDGDKAAFPTTVLSILKL